MAMVNLNGKMDLFIEEIIIKDKDKAMESFIIPKMEVLVKDSGKKEYFKDKVNMRSLKAKSINVFGNKGKLSVFEIEFFKF